MFSLSTCRLSGVWTMMTPMLSWTEGCGFRKTWCSCPSSSSNICALFFKEVCDSKRQRGVRVEKIYLWASWKLVVSTTTCQESSEEDSVYGQLVYLGPTCVAGFSWCGQLSTEQDVVDIRISLSKQSKELQFHRIFGIVGGETEARWGLGQPRSGGHPERERGKTGERTSRVLPPVRKTLKKMRILKPIVFMGSLFIKEQSVEDRTRCGGCSHILVKGVKRVTVSSYFGMVAGKTEERLGQPRSGGHPEAKWGKRVPTAGFFCLWNIEIFNRVSQCVRKSWKNTLHL